MSESIFFDALRLAENGKFIFCGRRTGTMIARADQLSAFLPDKTKTLSHRLVHDIAADVDRCRANLRLSRLLNGRSYSGDHIVDNWLREHEPLWASVSGDIALARAEIRAPESVSRRSVIKGLIFSGASVGCTQLPSRGTSVGTTLATAAVGTGYALSAASTGTFAEAFAELGSRIDLRVAALKACEGKVRISR